MQTRARTSLFDRVVCGVDRSEAGATAARAAALLASPDGSLGLVAVDDPSIAVHVGSAMSRVLQELTGEARSALVRGRAEAEQLHALEAILVDGDPLHCLLAEIARREATLAAVGSHSHSFAPGFALGSVSAQLLREAPCSVLIARGTIDVGHWPADIVVGLDGSIDSKRALDAAEELSERLGSTVQVIEEWDSTPLEALTGASSADDLIVVGRRGIGGQDVLGSLSERLAHEAKCSVLVVRTGD